MSVYGMLNWPSKTMGHFLTLLYATRLRFNLSHCFSHIVHGAGNTAGCTESICYICPHLGLLLVCNRAWMLRLEKCLIFCKLQQGYAAESLPPSWFRHRKNGADVKENPSFFSVTAKYRRLYAVTVVTDSFLCIVAAIWQGCHNFESCT